ncbi:HNH endonuclease [Lysobacter gummosus]|jgi:5-methylcytosine-specific restriction endonuclease McrA|uniref:HNH endonuclease n=2 Tax=Lysobacteraceae TaxID=32033 RepID=A0ABY3X987_9GAMM|nr:HNH endonuclease [Lysobacter gummosus]ALN92466.1 HNH endonuclease family protein [Lysobacter gummosus]UJB20642.1 HNH endonuclease [Lysobacter capsici]UJQ30244.1 HNH endonuclease [Lysobacter gummosus]UNP28044.1 HNH endonuclease [Lysobacter gummosus]
METDRAKIRLVRTGTHAEMLQREPDASGVGDPYSPWTGPRAVPRNALERLNSVRLLSLDAHGRVLDWMNWQEASCLYARGAVAWTLGDPCLEVHGGINRFTGERSVLELHPIVAARGHARPGALDPTPALTNAALFARDGHLCMYCGHDFHRPHLTRDHVVPVSKGGRDIWENVVAACFACNSRKGNRTPQQASMPLLAVPYRPSWVEHLILSNRNILADQMAFLKNQLPKNARLNA